MAGKLLFILLFVGNFIYSQKDSVLEKKTYKNGNLKEIVFYRGTDTIELRKYYKTGQLGDSVWLAIDGKNETAFGIEKSYFENGKPSSITYHGKERDEYITDSYRENGMLYSHIVKPTGVSKYYNSKGEVIKQFDENKFDADVYVRKKYKKQRHLKETNYATRIKSKEAYLTDDKNKVKIKSGVLISLVLNSDTTVLNHCQVEGFSNDSIYLSKFDYNLLYDRSTNFDILKYDSTFALSLSKVKTIIYSKHYNKKRSFGALAASITGTELKVFPLLFGILLYKDFVKLSPYYGGSIAAGFLLSYYSKYLYKSMVPKTYDMNKWQLKVKS
ncbi:MAG: hypothetical protein Q8T03_13055 [Bacteroidota bacterium]|nr:hypothetical protein [Bacteroidota bacterium]